MISEVTFKHFLLTLDVVKNAIDFNGFVEYLKTVEQKEVTIVNT
jgi:hypothetical protein